MKYGKFPMKNMYHKCPVKNMHHQCPMKKPALSVSFEVSLVSFEVSLVSCEGWQVSYEEHVSQVFSEALPGVYKRS